MRKEVELKFLFHTMDEFPKDGSGRFANYLIIDKDGYWRIGHTSDDKTFYMTGCNDYPINRPQAYAEITSAQSAIVMHMLNMPKKIGTAKKCLFDGELSWNFIADWLINCISGYTGVSSSVFTADSVYYLPSECLPNMSEAIRLSFGVDIPTTMYSKWSKIKDIVHYIYDSRELLG